MLDNGISVVSVEYRFISEATANGEKPPVRGPMSDAARALQFVRSNAGAWGIDKQRVGACGGSAGGCTSLWLAFSNDLADPDSNDPVARESTRLMCAATWVPQTSLDPLQMKEWIPNSKYGGHAFGFKGDAGKGISEFDNFLAGRDTILKWIDTYSPYALVTAGDPPVYMYYYTPPSMGQAEKDPTHSSNFGAKLQEKCRKVGIECELVYPGAPDVIHKQLADYFIAKLKKKVNQ
jgi:acetyl esterase/lipase